MVGELEGKLLVLQYHSLLGALLLVGGEYGANYRDGVLWVVDRTAIRTRPCSSEGRLTQGYHLSRIRRRSGLRLRTRLLKECEPYQYSTDE